MIRRPPRSTQSRSSAASDVYKRQLEDRISAARLVCFPTDTVYGVGGALTPAVAGALVAATGRDLGKPLQVVFATVEALEDGVALAPELRIACRRLLPGPVTRLLPYPAGWDFPPPGEAGEAFGRPAVPALGVRAGSYTHLRAHETRHDLVCRLL